MNRWRIEYHNGLIDILRSSASCVSKLAIKHNEGIASITFMQPVRSGEPSKWKPHINA